MYKIATPAGAMMISAFAGAAAVFKARDNSGGPVRAAFMAMALLFLVWTSASHAGVVYQFEGTCGSFTVSPDAHSARHKLDVPCSELVSDKATVTLLLSDNYRPGKNDFVQFLIAAEYRDGGFNVELVFSQEEDRDVLVPVDFPYEDTFAFVEEGAHGVLPATAGFADVWIFTEGHQFESYADGSWRYICCEFGSLHLMTGVNGVWTRFQSVPEPSSLSLLALVFVVVALWCGGRNRSRESAQPASRRTALHSCG